MNLKPIHFIILLIFLISSCSVERKAISPEKYSKWYSSSDFKYRKTDTLNELIYSVSFFPKEIEIANCALNSCKTKSELIEMQHKKTDNYEFIFQIQTKKWSDLIANYCNQEGVANDIYTYFTSDVYKNIYAISSSDDTLKCLGALYEPVTQDRIRFLFTIEGTFPLKKILFEDKLFSGVLKIFELPELDINKIPTLKL